MSQQFQILRARDTTSRESHSLLTPGCSPGEVPYVMQSPLQVTRHDRLLRYQEVCRVLGVSRSTVVRLVKAGMLSPPIDISARAVGFKESDIDAFIATRTGMGATLTPVTWHPPVQPS